MVRRLLANWELKLLSVVIAFALWLVVVGGGKSQLAVAAVVEYTGLDGDLVLVGRPRDTVDVEVEAARWAVTRLTPGAVARTLRVVPQIRGAPDPDHAILRVAVEPAIVQVKGPRSTIEGQTAVETVPVDIAGRHETVTQSVGLVLPESVYLTDQQRVLVTVEISRRSR